MSPAGPSEYRALDDQLGAIVIDTFDNRREIASVEDENSRPTSIVNLVVAPTRKNFRSVPPSSKSRVTATEAAVEDRFASAILVLE
jgi:hypothetical protein